MEERPFLFDPTIAADRAAVEALRNDPSIIVCDTLRAQVVDLAQTRSPTRELHADELPAAVERILGGAPMNEFGRWVHFPWSRTLVHILPPAEFGELRSDRNRNKITQREQKLLAQRTVAIAGLSVGLAIATTLALEGIAGTFHLADFDDLSLSNLNRLLASVSELGVNKARLAARRLWELNPYLTVRVFPEGVVDESLEPFLAGVDLLCEECDDLYAKVRLREVARTRRIPVLMETSDRGMLDVERFDLEPERPLFHGRLADVPSAALRALTTKEKVPFVLRILGLEMSDRMSASLLEVRETVWTWPQLGSAVALGGASAAHAARTILLGLPMPSGRLHVDLERLVPGPAPLEFSLLEGLVALEPETLPLPVRGSAFPSDDEVAWLVHRSALAPSAGNAQPWRFRRTGATSLDVVADPGRGLSALDRDGTASVVALGGAAENLVLSAGQIGIPCSVEFSSEPVPSFRATFGSRGEPVRVERDLIRLRRTSRGIGSGAPLSPEVLATLRAAADGEVELITDRHSLDALADLLAAADRLRLLNPTLHDEFVRELRWSHASARETGDGLDVATLELPPADEAGLRILARKETIDTARALGLGTGLGALSRRDVRGASAFALVSAEGTDRQAFFEGGRRAQRMWLSATELGVSVRPYGLPFLLRRTELGIVSEFDASEIEVLHGLSAGFRRLFPRPGRAEALLVRLADCAPPATKSLRRGLHETYTP